MNWIFEHFNILVIVGSAIAWWISQRREEQTPPEQRDPAPGRPKIDYEELERTRKIQEDIRRKISQRRGEPAEEMPPARHPQQGTERPSPQATQPPIPPVLREILGIPEETVRPPEPPSPPPVPSTSYDSAPELSAQERMERQIAELEQQRRDAEKQAAAVEFPKAKLARRQGGSDRETSPVASRVDLAPVGLLETLRSARSARRAIVLREILDKPVSLR